MIAKGNKAKILEFLREKPIEAIENFSWDKLYWLLLDYEFFKDMIKLLKEQHRFVANV